MKPIFHPIFALISILSSNYALKSYKEALFNIKDSI